MSTPKRVFLTPMVVALLIGAMPVLAANKTGTSSPTIQARALVHELASGHYAAVEAEFNAQMRRGLPEAKLKQFWGLFTAEHGKYMSTGETKTVPYMGDTIVLVKTRFKNGSFWAQVAFEKSGKVAGLYFKPTTP